MHYNQDAIYATAVYLHVLCALMSIRYFFLSLTDWF